MLLDGDSPYGALLVQVYGNDLWELLENGNYELLADQVFENQEKMVGCMLLDLCVGCDVFKASSFGLHVIQRPMQFSVSPYVRQDSFMRCGYSKAVHAL